MKLVIPSTDPTRRSYEIKVRRELLAYYNKTLGLVAMKKPNTKSKIICFVHIPGHDYNRAFVCNGQPYDGRKK